MHSSRCPQLFHTHARDTFRSLVAWLGLLAKRFVTLALPNGMFFSWGGGILTMFWGGLRFADAQRACSSDLSEVQGTVRGIIWRTKTSRRGQHFGLQACGFTGNAGLPESAWAIHYVRVMQWWTRETAASAIEG